MLTLPSVLRRAAVAQAPDHVKFHAKFLKA